MYVCTRVCVCAGLVADLPLPTVTSVKVDKAVKVKVEEIARATDKGDGKGRR